MTLFLVLDLPPHVDRGQVAADMPRTFRSRDFMDGYLTGYLFGAKFWVLTPQEVAYRINTLSGFGGMVLAVEIISPEG